MSISAQQSLKTSERSGSADCLQRQRARTRRNARSRQLLRTIARYPASVSAYSVNAALGTIRYISRTESERFAREMQPYAEAIDPVVDLVGVGMIGAMGGFPAYGAFGGATATAVFPARLPLAQYVRGRTTAQLVRRVLRENLSISRLSPQIRDRAAYFYRKAAQETVGEHAAAARAYNLLRADYLQGLVQSIQRHLPSS